MKKFTVIQTFLLASAVSLLLSGCVYRERRVYREPGRVVTTEEVVVTGAPPAPIVEERIITPGPGFIWIGGGWVWRGRWEWEHGHWERPPRRGAVWVPHRYVYRNGAHVFVRGGWR